MTGVQRLWLIRHAPADGPVGVIHPLDVPAVLPGPAVIAAQRAQLPAGAACIASPARRTVDTARALVGDAFATDAAFVEQDFGAWTGRAHAAIAADDPDAARLFWDAPATRRPPGGESFAEQIGRCRIGLDRRREPADLVLVVHSGTVRAVLALALALDPAAALRFVIDPFSLTRIDRIDGDWRVVGVNLG